MSMNDEDLVRLCAEKVMGWRRAMEPPLSKGTFGINALGLCVPTGACEDDWANWNPLTNDADSCAVLDKMVTDGWTYLVSSGCQMPHKPGDVCCIFKKGDGRGECFNDDRKRAVVLASLRAKGVNVDE